MKAPRCLHLLLALFLTLALTPQLHAQGLTRLGEFKVNSLAASLVSRHSIDSDAQGNTVVVWEAIGPDGSGAGVFGRRYNTAGSPLGSDFQVNVTTANAQAIPGVAVKPDGSFVIVWESNAVGGNFGVYLRRYGSDGQPLTGELLVSTTTPGNQGNPSVAIAANGAFVVVWNKLGVGEGIYGQRFTSAGTATGSEFKISQDTTGAQDSPRVSLADDGSFVVAWRTDASGTNDYEVWARRYGADGIVRGDQFDVPTAPGAQDMLDVAVAADGRFVVVWANTVGDGSGYGIFGRNYAANGTAGAPFPINNFTTGAQTHPSVAFGPDGGFVVAWRSANADGAGDAVAARRFAANGSALADEFVVNTTAVGDQRAESSSRAVAFDPEGNFMVVWTNAATEMRADKFYLPNQGPPLSEFRVNTTTPGDQTNPVVAMSGSGQAVIVWEGPDGSGKGIVAQRYDATGRRVGPEIQVNAGLTMGEQAQPAVGMDSAGNFAVVWRSVQQDAGNDAIYLRRFLSDGTADPAHPLPEKVNQNSPIAANGGFLTAPDVAVSAAGRIVVCWWGVSGEPGPYQLQASGYRFYPLGGSPGNEDYIDASDVDGIGGGVNRTCSVAFAPDETFAIAWYYHPQANVGETNIRFHDVNGNAPPPPNSKGMQVSKVGDVTYNPSVRFSSAGNGLVVWDDSIDQVNSNNIYARVLNSDHTLGNFVSGSINAASNITISAPSVASLGSAGFAVVYSANGLDNDGYGVALQRVSTTGSKLGLEVVVNSTRSGNQSVAGSAVGHAIASDALGNYMVVWQSQNQDGSGYGIYATKQFITDPPTVATLPATNIGGQQATLHGTIDTNGLTATIAFEYDEDAGFNSPGVVQVPGSFSDPNPQPVEQVVTQGLSKGVQYFYRAKATVGTQVIVGNVLDFTTANAAPVAVDDTVFVAGSQVSFLPQGNDSDLDQTASSLVVEVLTQPVAAGGAQAGTVQAVPGSNRLSFQANSAFVEGATFTYQVKDTDDAVSNVATVTLVRFGALKGTYQGLVSGTGGAGSLVLTLNGTAGQVTGALIFQGVRYVLNGAFNEAGLLQDFIGTTGLGLFLAIGTDGTITGTIRDLDGVVVAEVTLDLIDGGSGDDFEPVTGQYTTFLELPDTAAPLAGTNGGSPTIATPEGTGFLVLNIGSKKAKFPLRIAGELPDRTKLMAGGIGLAKRRYTIAKQLYKAGKDFRGDIFGRPEFLDGTTNQLDTEFAWNKRPPAPEARALNAGGGNDLFDGGFANLRLLLQAVPFRVLPHPFNFVDDPLPNVSITFRRGGIPDSPVHRATLSISPQNKLLTVNADPQTLTPTLKLKAHNPLFSGTFKHPDFPKPVKFQGIFVQGVEQRGRGVFIGTDDFGTGTQQGATGKVLLEKIAQ